MKSIYTLAIVLGVCVSLCLAVPPTTTSQSASSSAVASTPVKVYTANNQTDAAIWNGYFLTTPGTNGVAATNVFFGPGANNGTAYVYGVVAPSGTPATFSKIYRRNINASIVANGTDTTEASVIKDDTITSSTPATTFSAAVGPNYLALLSQGSDGTNNQVYVNLVTGTSATQYKITATLDVAAATCTGSSNTATTTTTYTLGNIWYDIGSAAFFFTYSKSVATRACSSGTPGATTTAYTIMLGGLYTNGTAFYTNPGLSFTPSTAANAVNNLIAGGDNWTNSANIWVVYKDNTAAKVYSAKIAKNATAGGSFSQVVADDSTSNAAKVYTPVGVWASDNTYGIAIAVSNQTSATAYNYPIQNYLNGSTTPTDSGLSYTGVTGSGGSALGLWGWKLNTGYTLLGAWPTSTSGTLSYNYATFYANGTVNSTQVNVGSLQGPVGVYEDVNGTMWLGYTDVDTTDSMTYNGWLAKLQNQLNGASSGAAKLIAMTWCIIAVIFASLF
jgi:hypothetical protein